MKIKNKISTLLLFLLTIGSVFGQTVEHSFRRELTGVTEEWHKLVLPNEIYGNTSQDLSDLRIIGVTAEGDTIEAPYLLQLNEEEVVTEDVAFTIINETHNSQGSFFTFDTSAKEAINLIKLDFAEDNFDWQLKLEGSQNQQEWFTLRDEYRILSIKNKLTDFSFTKVSFPNSKFKFYRLFIDSPKKPRLTKASLQLHQVRNGVFKTCSIKEISTNHNRKTKQTEIELELQIPLPVSSVKLEVNDTFDFYRPITIKYLADSLKIEKDWKYNYHTLTSGTLNSLEENEFKSKIRTVKKLKIIIDNHDNQPLDIGSIIVKGYRYELVARFSEPAEYFLTYGNKELTKPSYDIARFKKTIPAKLTVLNLGTEEIVEHEINEKSPLFQNKLWLWGIMILMILLLGFVAVRMIREG